MDPQIKAKIENFVLHVKQAAQKAAEELNVPLLAVLAQWALESGWGQSSLAKHYNNLGGIKAGSGWTGDTVEMSTKEKDGTELENAMFRSYPSVDAYAEDYVKLLQKERYKNVHGAEDVRDFGIKLTQAGYSQDTPEKYAQQLVSIAIRIDMVLKGQA